MLSINLFEKPTRHPYGMCRGMTHGFEAEQTLTWMLSQCVKAGEWVDVAVVDSPLFDEGLIEAGDTPGTAHLTEKAKGLLYAYYGKGVNVHAKL